MNKRLRIVSLEWPDPLAFGEAGETEEDHHARSLAEKEHTEERHQAELLPSVLTLDQRLAFLSTIQHESVPNNTLCKLDSFMVSSIFQFAAEHLRRQVL